MDFSYFHLLNGALFTTLAKFSNGDVAVNGKLDKYWTKWSSVFELSLESLIYLEELRKSQLSGTNFEIGNSRVRSPYNVP
jgi:hypothetical protein